MRLESATSGIASGRDRVCLQRAEEIEPPGSATVSHVRECEVHQPSRARPRKCDTGFVGTERWRPAYLPAVNSSSPWQIRLSSFQGRPLPRCPSVADELNTSKGKEASGGGAGRSILCTMAAQSPARIADGVDPHRRGDFWDVWTGLDWAGLGTCKFDWLGS